MNKIVSAILILLMGLSMSNSNSVISKEVDKDLKKIYIVFTNDHELTFTNGFLSESGYMSAEDYKINMIQKAEKIKSMLDVYNYPMSWYMSSEVFFPKILEEQGLPRDKWVGLWKEKQNFIRELGLSGHEVSFHTHTMFNYDLSMNLETNDWNAILYNSETQKFYPNPNYLGNNLQNNCSTSYERYHLLFPNNRAGAINEIGTKSWWIYKNNKILTDLTNKQPLTMRHGGYQVGCDEQTMQTSALAFLNSGIIAVSDADGNIGQTAAVPKTDDRYRGYFATKENHNLAIGDSDWDIVQFPILASDDKTKRFVLEITSHLEDVKTMLNDTITHIQENEPNGIYILTAITHTKQFLGGNGTATGDNWKVLNGGSWDSFEELLSWIDTSYVQTGIVEVATATDAVKSYINYYSQDSISVISHELENNIENVREFSLEVLAKDNSITKTSKVNPSLFVNYDDVQKIEIFENGVLVKTVDTFDLTDTFIQFVYSTGENMTIRITSNSLNKNVLWENGDAFNESKSFQKWVKIDGLWRLSTSTIVAQ